MSDSPSILIDISQQRLTLNEGDQLVKSWPVSTALNGAGELEGSGCTPRGLHQIAEKIGEGASLNAVFVGRKFTGEIYTPALASAHPDRDWILTRILWLAGLEPGKNLGAEVDTQARYIYIHGTPDTEPMGVPASHGCIRMRNEALIELFDQVTVATQVRIVE